MVISVFGTRLPIFMSYTVIGPNIDEHIIILA